MTPDSIATSVLVAFRQQTASRNFDARECRFRCDLTKGSDDEKDLQYLIAQALVDWANEVRRANGPG